MAIGIITGIIIVGLIIGAFVYAGACYNNDEMGKGFLGKQ